MVFYILGILLGVLLAITAGIVVKALVKFPFDVLIEWVKPDYSDENSILGLLLDHNSWLGIILLFIQYGTVIVSFLYLYWWWSDFYWV